VAAVITATMSTSDVGTKVIVETDLTISGKVAQFGRGVLADVSAKLLDQFVSNLESTVLTPTEVDPTASEDAPTTDESRFDDESPSSNGSDAESPTDDDAIDGVRHIHSEPSEPVDLVDLAGGSVARSLLKPLAIAGAAIIILRTIRRRRK
jgi:hypothetical protein